MLALRLTCRPLLELPRGANLQVLVCEQLRTLPSRKTPHYARFLQQENKNFKVFNLKVLRVESVTEKGSVVWYPTAAYSHTKRERIERDPGNRFSFTQGQQAGFSAVEDKNLGELYTRILCTQYFIYIYYQLEFTFTFLRRSLLF